MFKRLLSYLIILLFICSCGLFFYNRSINEGYLMNYIDHIRTISHEIKVTHDDRGLIILYHGKDMTNMLRELIVLNIKIDRLERGENCFKIYALLEGQNPEKVIKEYIEKPSEIQEGDIKPIIRCMILE